MCQTLLIWPCRPHVCLSPLCSQSQELPSPLAAGWMGSVEKILDGHREEVEWSQGSCSTCFFPFWTWTWQWLHSPTHRSSPLSQLQPPGTLCLPLPGASAVPGTCHLLRLLLTLLIPPTKPAAGSICFLTGLMQATCIFIEISQHKVARFIRWSTTRQEKADVLPTLTQDSVQLGYLKAPRHTGTCESLNNTHISGGKRTQQGSRLSASHSNAGTQVWLSTSAQLCKLLRSYQLPRHAQSHWDNPRNRWERV